MSHQIEKMVFAGETPWHNLGTEIDDATNFWDAYQLAGLDYVVNTEPLYRKNGEQVSARASVRADNDKVLAVVGPNWTAFQNRDAFRTFEPLIESGDMRLHTAGSLRGGARIWVLCQLGLSNTEIVPNDEIAKFALLSNGHDSKLSVCLGFTPIRVCCANTEALARNCQASRLIRVRHHRFVKDNVEKLRDLMNVADAEFEATADQYRFLASRQISSADLTQYVRIVFGVKPDSKVSSRLSNIIGKVEEFFLIGKGNDIPGVSGTYWAAYNGVTEFLNYQRGRSQAIRLNSLWFGANKTISSRALDAAVAMAT